MTVLRGYAGPEDVTRLQSFSARVVADHGWCGQLHVGDIPHRMFNALRFDDLAQLAGIWETDAGQILGWVLVYPRERAFDIQMDPGCRLLQPDLEAEMVTWGFERTKEAATEAGDVVETDVFVCDSERRGLLDTMGWQDEGPLYTRTIQPIEVSPSADLPDGYAIRSVSGPDEAGTVAAVHAAGFGSTWSEALYRRLMASPGYEPERELVVVAPDGSLAGFCIVWFDQVNLVGLFEPLAVHPEHRRKGIGRALLSEGMARMSAASMTSAMVTFGVANEASGDLYQGMGFVPTWEIRSYARPVDG